MTPDPADRRLDDLLVRHWAGELTADEADELDRLLADPAADALLEAHALLAVAVAEGAAADRHRPDRPTRRGWLRTAVAAGLAAGGAVGGGAWWLGRRPGQAAGARVVWWSGTVWVKSPAAAAARAVTGDVLAAGGSISTVGLDAAALLSYPDGTAVVLTGDTVARVVGPGARRLVVERGAVTAAVPAEPFTLTTAEASATTDGGARMALTRAAERTEVGVTEGRVRLTDPDGDPLGDMGGGEVATVAPHGAAQRSASVDPPGEYTWNLARPLPLGWDQGRVVLDATAGPAGRALVPDLKLDRHIHRHCWMVRSDNKWLRGLFLVHPDSTFRVRYKVDRPGVGQLLAVVRRYTPVPDPNSCNVLLAPVPFEPAADGGWRTLTYAADDWEVEAKPGRVAIGPRPWFVFAVAFNTYEEDLGLRVAEFTVARGPLS